MTSPGETTTADVSHDLILLARTTWRSLALDRKSERGLAPRPALCAPGGSGAGIATALLRAAAEHVQAQGAEMLELEVLESNTARRAALRAAWLPDRSSGCSQCRPQRSSTRGPDGPSFGFVHVQTDDVETVEAGRRQGAPARAGRRGRERLGRVRADATDAVTRHGSRRLAKELSYTSGGVVLSLGVEDGAVVRYVLFDRGADVDEYLSVPEYYGDAAAGRRVCARCEPDRGRSPDRRRPEARARGRANRRLARRAAARAGAVRANRRRSMGVQP